MNLYEILQNSGRVGEGMTHFERLFAQKVGCGKINEISGVPPLRYIGDGRPLTDYLISGNAVQDGTPTPESPVPVVGCGMRTGNLAPPLTEWEDGYVAAASGVILRPSSTLLEKVTGLLPIPAGRSKVSFLGEDGDFESGSDGAWQAIGFYGPDGAFISRPGGNGTSAITVSVPEGAAFMRVCCRTYGSDKNYMLNLGSTTLPYEPYGIKLPLTVNGTEYPIYLGQVESTRRVKKLVLTGEETWKASPSNKGSFYKNIAGDVVGGLSMCDRAVNASTLSDYAFGKIYVEKTSYSSKFLNVWLFNSGISIAGFKSYLAQQYANGTPVTVWYVLAEPETAVVNEPLMKIDDYADTVSFAQAGVTIPTVNGENVLDVPTEVKPSEVWIRGRIKEV